ncbi:hypothetical protein CPB86DRAFT_701959 [Serendipita vermifera]|nr:hypothetical protein CPB86DRAFT_701959 [Serendipita vermifera]
MLDSHPLNRKRSASTASIGDPDKDSKRTKLEITLETRLAELQKSVSKICNEWEPFAPYGFMNDTRKLRDKFNGLSLNEVEEYITGYGLKAALSILKLFEAILEEPLPPIMDSEELELTKEAHERMIDYVKDVRAHLTGQF